MQLNEYQAEVRLHGYVLPVGISPIAYRALGLAGEAGEVAEKVKKMIRDDGGVLTEERRQAIKLELGDVFAYLSELALDAGLSLQEVADANLDKIKGRRLRGTTHGSGDNR